VTSVRLCTIEGAEGVTMNPEFSFAKFRYFVPVSPKARPSIAFAAFSPSPGIRLSEPGGSVSIARTKSPGAKISTACAAHAPPNNTAAASDAPAHLSLFCIFSPSFGYTPWPDPGSRPRTPHARPIRVNDTDHPRTVKQNHLIFRSAGAFLPQALS